MIPIYEQIVDQIKKMISHGELKNNDPLPSVRALSKELKIKKAYDTLENAGFTKTIHGKGTYVSSINQELLLEETKKEIEDLLEKAILKAKQCGIEDDEMKAMFAFLLEE